jgi:hypothetical protein
MALQVAVVKKKKNNKNKNRNTKNVKTLVKQVKNEVKQVKKFNKNIKVRKYNQKQLRISRASMEFLKCVVNPCHYLGCPRIPDLSVDMSMPLFDTLVLSQGISFGISQMDSPIPAIGLYIYSVYGPNRPSGSENEQSPQLGWVTYMVPVDSSGLPIMHSTLQFPVWYPTDNYETIWGLAATARMVSYGFRVTPLNELVTDYTVQHISNYYPCQMRFSDWYAWIQPTNTISIGSFIESSQGYWAKYENKDGASSRYNPFQDPYIQMKYFDRDYFEAADQYEDFATEHYRYPGIFIVFSQTINPVAIPSFNYMVEKKGWIDLGHTIIPKHFQTLFNKEEVKTMDDDDVKSNVSSYSNIRFNDNKKIEDKSKTKVGHGVDVGQAYIYTFPLKFEIRLFIEATLQNPTPLYPTRSPVDMNWNDIHPFIVVNQPPLWSDGHSFKSNWNWLKKNVFKHVTPQNVIKAGRYTANMIKAGKQAYGDMTAAYYG